MGYDSIFGKSSLMHCWHGAIDSPEHQLEGSIKKLVPLIGEYKSLSTAFLAKVSFRILAALLYLSLVEFIRIAIQRRLMTDLTRHQSTKAFS